MDKSLQKLWDTVVWTAWMLFRHAKLFTSFVLKKNNPSNFHAFLLKNLEMFFFFFDENQVYLKLALDTLILEDSLEAGGC